jgi:RimJ/RimL family protein N-acetyltransferase
MLSTRELRNSDIPALLQYWFPAEHSFLTAMGVDINKIPTPDQFAIMLEEQIATPIEQRRSYCIIWEIDGKPIGHCNTNPTTFGEEAKMHLHLWHSGERRKGIGTALVKMTLPCFFHDLQLKTLWCEPYALNPAPNKTLEKVGFELVKEYITVPGFINFEQPVKQWKMTSENFSKLNLQQ